MKTGIILCLTLLVVRSAISQPLYFPPLTGTTWETVSPASLGWRVDRIDTLADFLQRKNSKAFIVLMDGRIAIERYFGTFTRDSIWYWASAGKTLTAFITGIAQQEGTLSLSDTTARYLGAGWTSCPPDKERRISILNQLTMTSGLRDNVPDPYCTLPSCLLYQADAGTRWAYHNAPYTLLDSVIEAATGQTYNQYFATKVRTRTGMNGLWLPSGYNNVYFSNARSMARYGLLVQNRGIWSADTLMRDTSYFRRMTNTSQSLNLSYGYLWWLNGKASYMLPQTQIVFPGSWAPNAPQDMIAALGKNGQILNVVPSLGLVLVRMGDVPDTTSEVATVFNNQIWQKLNEVIFGPTAVQWESVFPGRFKLHQNYPNPFNPATTIEYDIGGVVAPSGAHHSGVEGRAYLNVRLAVFDIFGREVATLVNEENQPGTYSVHWDASGVASGIYFCRLSVVPLARRDLVPTNGRDGQAGQFSAVRKMLLMK